MYTGKYWFEPSTRNMKKKIVYIAHPVSGNIKKNIRDLARILRAIHLGTYDVIPFAPYYGTTKCLNDRNPLEREVGIQSNIALINTGCFDECWLTGDEVSNGMLDEQELFISLGIKVVNFVGLI